MRGLHSAICATGARAEVRGPCDCGAGELPYRARMLDLRDAQGHRMIDIHVDGPLTPTEAVMMSIMLQELAKEEGRLWAMADARRRTQ